MKELLEFVRKRDAIMLKENVQQLSNYKKFLGELRDIETFFHYLNKRFNLLRRYVRDGESPQDILSVKTEIAQVIQDNINEFRSVNFDIGQKETNLGNLIVSFLEENSNTNTVVDPETFYNFADNISNLISEIRSDIQDVIIKVKGDYKQNYDIVQSTVASEKEQRIKDYYTVLEKLPAYRKDIQDLEQLFSYILEELVQNWWTEVSKLRIIGKYPDSYDISVEEQKTKALQARDEIINLIKDHIDEFEKIDFSIDMEEAKKKDYLRNFLLQNSDPNTILPPAALGKAIEYVILKMLLHARKKVKTLSVELKEKINSLM